MSRGPTFDGLRIVEFGQFVAVPFCAELFANGGAEVIKIEPVSGDITRHNTPLVPGEGRQYIIKARGKKSLPIDLSSPEGLEVAKRLVLAADVVVTNMRPGNMRNLGLDYETLSPENPRLVYGEISGFGPEGPQGDKAGIDVVTQSYSGLTVSGRAWKDGHPVGSEAFLTDYMSGALLAFGISAALLERERSGKGQHVTTTLLQAALALQHGAANVFHAFDGWKDELVQRREAGDVSLQDAIQAREANAPSDRWFYNTFETVDGFVTVAAVAAMRGDFARIIGLDDERALLQPSQLPDDPRPLIKELTAKARASVVKLTTAFVLAACDEVGIPCAEVNVLEEVLLGEQARANGFSSNFDHPVVGEVTMPAEPVQFSESIYRTAETSPAFGEHSRELLRDLGYDETEAEQLFAEGTVGIPENSPW